MSEDPIAGAAQARRLTQLTDRLTARLEAESQAFAEHRAADVMTEMARTQELANQYRRETAQMKAAPALVAAAPMADRKALIQSTERFEAVLKSHAVAVEAARIVSEGLVRIIAHEVSNARAMGTGYGASGRAAAGDGRAITFNRTA